MLKSNRKFLVFALVVCSLLVGPAHAQNAVVTRSPILTLTTGMGDALSSCLSGASSLPLQCYEPGTRLMIELSSLGTRGDLIARVREQTLQILTSDNACTAWFEGVQPNVADVFRSLHYDIDAGGTDEIYSIKDSLGDLYFKHPWGAKSIEYSGRDAFIQFNGNGPFFIHKTRVTPSDARSALIRIEEPQPVYIGPYRGASTEARLTIMLHELGHIVGRIPKDDNSWNGSSSENTREVLRHCKKEIRDIARAER